VAGDVRQWGGGGPCEGAELNIVNNPDADYKKPGSYFIKPEPDFIKPDQVF
jgi:hypothetical protein